MKKLNEMDSDMIESIEMWLHEIEPKWVEKEHAWLEELRTRLAKEPVSEDLEDELDRFIASGKSVTVDDYGTYKVSYHDFKKVARHFAKWGAEHLKTENK